MTKFCPFCNVYTINIFTVGHIHGHIVIFWFLGNYYLSYFMINESQESTIQNGATL